MKAFKYSCDDDMEKQFFTAEHVKFRDDDVCSACGKKDGELQIPEDVKQQHKKVFGICESCKTAGRHCVTGNKRNAAQQKAEGRQVKRTRTVEAVNVEEEEEENEISSEEEIDLLTETEDEEEGNEGE